MLTNNSFIKIFVIVTTIVLSACNHKEKSAKAAVHNYIKKTLRDPNSFEVYNETAEKQNKHTYLITVDYGAKNGFGGIERTKEKYLVIGGNVVKQ